MFYTFFDKIVDTVLISSNVVAVAVSGASWFSSYHMKCLHSADYADVCPSVRLSVRPSHAIIVSIVKMAKHLIKLFSSNVVTPF